MCWKGADLSEFVATLYASHASELCSGAFDETSTSCSELDCATPLPNQRNLGDSGENDCQRAIGKAGIKHLVAIEKALERCGLLGNDRATCLADLAVQDRLEKAEVKLEPSSETSAAIAIRCPTRRSAAVPVPATCVASRPAGPIVKTISAVQFRKGRSATPATATRWAAGDSVSRGGAPVRSPTPAPVPSRRSTT
jgi:hypothetical protein